MGVEKIYTSDGIKLRDSKSKSLLGSVGSGAQNVPSAAPNAPQLSEIAADVDVIAQQAAQLDGLAKRLNEMRTAVAPTRAEDPIHEAENLSWVMSKLDVTELTPAQEQEAFRLLTNKAKKKLADGEIVAPTDEQYQAWLNKIRSDIDDAALTDSQKSALFAAVDRAEAAGTPDAAQFYIAQTLGKRMRATGYALDSEANIIASWHGVDEHIVRSKINEAAREYEEREAAGEDPYKDVPEEFSKGFRTSSGSAPKDKQTIYSLWKADQAANYEEHVSGEPRRVVVFDTETTGKDIYTEEVNIVQVAFTEFEIGRDGKTSRTGRRLVSYVRPPAREDGTIWTGPEQAVAVHGITVDQVKDAPTLAEIAPQIAELVNGATLAGHNSIGFDMPLLRMELDRAGYTEGVHPKQHIDTLLQARRYPPAKSNGDIPVDPDSGKRSNRLGILAQFHGVELTNAHDAEDDSNAVAGILAKLWKR